MFLAVRNHHLLINSTLYELLDRRILHGGGKNAPLFNS